MINLLYPNLLAASILNSIEQQDCYTLHLICNGRVSSYRTLDVVATTNLCAISFTMHLMLCTYMQVKCVAMLQCADITETSVLLGQYITHAS